MYDGELGHMGVRTLEGGLWCQPGMRTSSLLEGQPFTVFTSSHKLLSALYSEGFRERDEGEDR